MWYLPIFWYYELIFSILLTYFFNFLSSENFLILFFYLTLTLSGPWHYLTLKLSRSWNFWVLKFFDFIFFEISFFLRFHFFWDFIFFWDIWSYLFFLILSRSWHYLTLTLSGPWHYLTLKLSRSSKFLSSEIFWFHFFWDFIFFKISFF